MTELEIVTRAMLTCLFVFAMLCLYARFSFSQKIEESDFVKSVLGTLLVLSVTGFTIGMLLSIWLM